MRRQIERTLEDALSTLTAFRQDRRAVGNFEALAARMAATIDRGGSLLACGNGGSLAQAMHFAEECTGRFRQTRPALPAVALADPTQITCIANDFGFEAVFARQVEAIGRSGDLLLLLSTSGRSPNLLAAARAARTREISTAALLGQGGGKLAAEVDLPVVVPGSDAPERIQEIHQVILHGLLDALEATLFDAAGG